MGTDADWGDWGRRDPYYGVLTHDPYRTAQLTEEGLRDFFKSETDQVDYILGTARRHLDEGFRPRSVLDFGCGTGRLLVPFAGMSEAVTGVDVSDGMLEEASRNCKRRKITNGQEVFGGELGQFIDAFLEEFSVAAGEIGSSHPGLENNITHNERLAVREVNGYGTRRVARGVVDVHNCVKQFAGTLS